MGGFINHRARLFRKIKHTRGWIPTAVQFLELSLDVL